MTYNEGSEILLQLKKLRKVKHEKVENILAQKLYGVIWMQWHSSVQSVDQHSHNGFFTIISDRTWNLKKSQHG